MPSMNQPVTVTCYGKTEKWCSRAEALAFFKKACRHSEGAERDRYLNIVWGLEDGKTTVDDHYW